MIALQVFLGSIIVGLGWSLGNLFYRYGAWLVTERLKARMFRKAMEREIAMQVEQARIQSAQPVTFTVIDGGKDKPEPGTN